jgi:hypothetical protein
VDPAYLSIPFAEADFDAEFRSEELLEGCAVAGLAAVAVVVGINHFRTHGVDEVGGVAHRHGERGVHANKGDVNIGERPDFSLIAGIACDVKTFAADGDNITVSGTWRVIGVVGMDRLHVEVMNVCGCAVTEDNGVCSLWNSETVEGGLRNDDGAIGAAHSLNGCSAEMVTVSVADENDVGTRQSRVGRSSVRGVIVYHFAVPAHDECGVADGAHDDIAVRGGNVVADKEVCACELFGAVEAGFEETGGGVGVLQGGRSAGCQSGEAFPRRQIGRDTYAVVNARRCVEREGDFVICETPHVGELGGVLRIAGRQNAKDRKQKPECNEGKFSRFHGMNGRLSLGSIAHLGGACTGVRRKDGEGGSRGNLRISINDLREGWVMVGHGQSRLRSRIQGLEVRRRNGTKTMRTRIRLRRRTIAGRYVSSVAVQNLVGSKRVKPGQSAFMRRCFPESPL